VCWQVGFGWDQVCARDSEYTEARLHGQFYWPDAVAANPRLEGGTGLGFDVVDESVLEPEHVCRIHCVFVWELICINECC
jgi:hypothetical protein